MYDENNIVKILAYSFNFGNNFPFSFFDSELSKNIIVTKYEYDNE